MKICPVCKMTYENPLLRFCGEDGTPLKEMNSAPPPERNYIQFSGAPVVFRYMYNGGLPGSPDYRSLTYDGKLDEKGWKITFTDQSAGNRKPSWKIRLNDETRKRLDNLFRQIEPENSPPMGAGVSLFVQTADGSTAPQLFLKNETARVWESLFYELERYIPKNPVSQTDAPKQTPNEIHVPQIQRNPIENTALPAFQPVTENPVQREPPAVAPIVSPSLLILFYANQFVRPAGLLGGEAVACQDAQVKTVDLAHELVAAAFWHLRERKLVNMAIGKSQGLIFKTTPVNAQFLQTGELNGGLEHDFLEILKARQTPFSVKDVVITYLRIDSKFPAQSLIERVRQWAVHHGFARAVQKKGLVFTKTEIEYDCAKIGALTNEAQAVRAIWQQFKEQEAALYAALVKECQGAISARTEREDDYDNDYSSFD